MKNQTITLYMTRSAFFGDNIFVNIGEAKDDCGHVTNGFTEIKLRYPGTIEDLKKILPAKAYRAQNAERGIKTDWYLSQQEMYDAVADKECFLFVEEAPIRTPRLEPISLPVEDYLHRNDRGLYTHLNLHPELDGFNARGKVYFPDRSCADNLTVGPVVITSVKDKGNYGFIVAENVKYEWPDDETVLDLINEETSMATSQLKYMKSKHFGNIVVEMQPMGLRRHNLFTKRRAFGMRNGELQFIYDGFVMGDEATEAKTVMVFDFICNAYFGHSGDKLLERFKEFAYAEKLRRRPYDKYISDLMDDAVDHGICAPMIAEEAVFYYELNRSGMCATLHLFSKEEIDEIVETINRINAEAVSHFQGLVKRGKIRIT